jgi:hypothetical protein
MSDRRVRCRSASRTGDNTASDNPLRREWRSKSKFVVGYSENLGQAHEFQTVLAATE